MTKTALQVIEDLLGEYPDKPAEYLAKRIVGALDKHGYRIIRHRLPTADEEAAFLSKQSKPR